MMTPEDIQAYVAAVRAAKASTDDLSRFLASSSEDDRLWAGSQLIDLAIGDNSLELAHSGLCLIQSGYQEGVSGASYMLGTANGVVAKLLGSNAITSLTACRVNRGESRRCLAVAGANREDPSMLRRRALINLGGELIRVGRWIEGYEQYRKAFVLSGDGVDVPTVNGLGQLQGGHPTAAGWMATSLLNVPDMLRPSSAGGIVFAHQLARISQNGHEIVDADSGSPVVERFSLLPTDRAKELYVPPTNDESYESFIAWNRLWINPVLDSCSPQTFDSFNVLPDGPRMQSPEMANRIVAMTNTVKADFLVARGLAFAGFMSTAPDTGLYWDSRDGARYGEPTAPLLLSIRSSLDCLDRIAVALNLLLEVGMKPRKVSFENLWRNQDQSLHPVLECHFTKYEDWLLVGLIEMSDDLRIGGMYESIRRTRNLATHRFVVAHENGSVPEADETIDRLGIDELRQRTLDALQLVRAAIVGFLLWLSHPAIAPNSTAPTPAE
jgi:LA2681-like HEPN